jgi:hypothetical protein
MNFENLLFLDLTFLNRLSSYHILDNQIIFELTASDAFLGGWRPKVDHLREEKNTQDRTK